MVCAVLVSGVIAVVGCSSSSNSASTGDASTADASTPDASVNDTGTITDAAMPPLGVPITSCAGCAICGGTLITATTGVSFCTVDCTTDADCPAGSGTACIPDILSTGLMQNECIKTCAADTDCSAPFVCRHDLPTPGGYCWSPYNETDAVTPFPDASAPQEAGTPDAAPAEAGTPDAALEAGSTTDAATDGPSE